jgi:two-component system sensor histidine kinase SenX3
VRTVVADFRQDGPAAGFQIECRIDETAEVVADPEALGRALRNLLENAVKYSPESRTVCVEVTRRAESVTIAVSDLGIGIPAGERRAIFDRFHRGAEARSRGIAGTGIGLAMVDHIVRAHRGRVEVESEVGHGSTFTIGIPAAGGDRSAGNGSTLEMQRSKT